MVYSCNQQTNLNRSRDNQIRKSNTHDSLVSNSNSSDTVGSSVSRSALGLSKSLFLAALNSENAQAFMYDPECRKAATELAVLFFRVDPSKLRATQQSDIQISQDDIIMLKKNIEVIELQSVSYDATHC